MTTSTNAVIGEHTAAAIPPWLQLWQVTGCDKDGYEASVYVLTDPLVRFPDVHQIEDAAAAVYPGPTRLSWGEIWKVERLGVIPTVVDGVSVAGRHLLALVKGVHFERALDMVEEASA